MDSCKINTPNTKNYYLINDKLPQWLQMKLNELFIEIYCSNTKSEIYNDILNIRSIVYLKNHKENYYEDETGADHYCAYVKKKASASIRVFHADKCKIECQDFYPKNIVDNYKHVLISATRFCSIANGVSDGNISNLLLQACWSDQAAKGKRIDIINVKLDMVRYYKRLGYLIASGTFFINPLWSTKSIVMLLPADEHHKNPFQESFKGIANQISVAELEKYIRLCEYSTSLLPKGNCCKCYFDVNAPCSLISIN